MPKLFIYIIGLIPLAITYEWLKGSLDGLGFLAVVIVYLLALRMVAEAMGRDSE